MRVLAALRRFLLGERRQWTPYPPAPRVTGGEGWAPPDEPQDPDDDCFGITGRPYQYGRCDNCGKPDGPQHFCTATHDQEGRRLFHITATAPNNEVIRIGSFDADDSVAVTLDINGVSILGVDLFYADENAGGQREADERYPEPVRVIVGSWTDVQKGEDWYRAITFDPDELHRPGHDHPLGPDHGPADHDGYTDSDCDVCGFEWSDPVPEGDA